MKKIVLLFAVALMVTGMAVAQTLSAVPTLSTESRFSAGRFSSDVDNFIDPRFHNPEIGTFFFLGGAPAGSFVDQTVRPFDMTRISLGFGQTFNAFYLGVYYGGNLVSADGGRWAETTDPEPFARWRNATWDNSLALLIAPTGMNMGFRLDLIMPGTTTEFDYDGNDDDWVWTRTRTDAAAVALTWGAQMGDLAPFASIGFQFPDRTRVRGTASGFPGGSDEGEATWTERSGTALGLFAGAELALNDTSAVGGELGIFGLFGSSTTFDGAWPDGDAFEDTRYGGGLFGISLHAYYAQTIDAGIVALGFKPSVDLLFLSMNQNVTGGPGDTDGNIPRTNMLGVSLGVDVGIRVQPSERFAFFTGAGLRLLEWGMMWQGDNDPYRIERESEWQLSGIAWDPTRFTSSGNLGFGMTFTPVENIVIGAGINSVVDRLFTINLADMTADTGDWWDDATWANNFVGAFTSLFSNLTFDLTVSVRL